MYEGKQFSVDFGRLNQGKESMIYERSLLSFKKRRKITLNIFVEDINCLILDSYQVLNITYIYNPFVDSCTKKINEIFFS